MKLIGITAAAVLFVATGSQAQADLIGDTITFSSNNSGMNTTTATVGPGYEFYPRVSPIYPDGFYVDFGANDMVITAALRDFSLLNFYWKLAFTDTTKAFNSVSFITSNLNGFNAGTVSLSGGILTVSIPDNVNFIHGTSARYAITVVPEPPSLALLGLGAFGLLHAARRRRGYDSGS